MSPLFPDDADELVSSINTTPLVDVMLVLLIIFLITVPVVSHSIPVELPRQVNQPTETTPRTITIAIDREGNTFWNQERIGDGLAARLKEVAGQTPQPEVHIRGDRQVAYEFVGKVVAACKKAGIAKVGFLTEPVGEKR